MSFESFRYARLDFEEEEASMYSAMWTQALLYVNYLMEKVKTQ